jgi:hypothetical protein
MLWHARTSLLERSRRHSRAAVKSLPPLNPADHDGGV